MLSRTAANLFWTARYIERAETNARLLEVAARHALLPDTGGGNRNEWGSILSASGTQQAFMVKYGDAVQRNVETHLFFDQENPSSVASCIHSARENGRIIRTALTTQVWEALNGAHAEMRDLSRRGRSELSTMDLVDWTLRTTALIRGAGQATQLRNDGWDFTNVGYALEKADSTARILDVKYYVLLPSVAHVGSGIDNYQWKALLRAMNANRAFAWLYGAGEMTPTTIVDFLVLNPQAPRSLMTSVTEALDHLDRLQARYGRATEAQERTRALSERLERLDTKAIFEQGLHQFLQEMLGEVAGLGQTVYDTYLSGDAR